MGMGRAYAQQVLDENFINDTESRVEYPERAKLIICKCVN